MLDYNNENSFFKRRSFLFCDVTGFEFLVGFLKLAVIFLVRSTVLQSLKNPVRIPFRTY